MNDNQIETNRRATDDDLPHNLELENLGIERRVIFASPGDNLKFRIAPHHSGEDFLNSEFEPTTFASKLQALEHLTTLGILQQQDDLDFSKLTHRLRPGVEGHEGSLAWHLTRYVELGHEVTSIQEIIRLEHLMNALRPPEELGSHSYKEDLRNASILLSVNGKLRRRSEANISVLDRSVLLGDAIWESFRVKNGRVLFFNEHMDRFDANVRELQFPKKEREEYKKLIVDVLKANEMHDGVHIRFIVSRGNSITPFQSPSVAYDGPTVMIIPEFKIASQQEKGLDMILSPYRRSQSDMLNPQMHVTSKIPDIINMILAETRGADEPLMLDNNGNVKAGSSVSLFVVKGNEVWVPTDSNLLKGITRSHVMNLVKQEPSLKLVVKDFSPYELSEATEIFVTGTQGGIAYVGSIDHREYEKGPVTELLQQKYAEFLEEDSTSHINLNL